MPVRSGNQLMANYENMSVEELEEERDRLEAELQQSDNDDEINYLTGQIEEIEDILDSFYPTDWE